MRVIADVTMVMSRFITVSATGVVDITVMLLDRFSRLGDEGTLRFSCSVIAVRQSGTYDDS